MPAPTTWAPDAGRTLAYSECMAGRGGPFGTFTVTPSWGEWPPGTLDYTVDFDTLAFDGDTISSVSAALSIAPWSVVAPAPATDAVVLWTLAAGNSVTVMLSGGTSGQTYRVLFTARSAAGRVIPTLAQLTIDPNYPSMTGGVATLVDFTTDFTADFS